VQNEQADYQKNKRYFNQRQCILWRIIRLGKYPSVEWSEADAFWFSEN